MGRMILRAITSDATALDVPFVGFTTTPKPQYESKKIDFCDYHHPNYFAILDPEMSLFSKICNRS